MVMILYDKMADENASYHGIVIEGNANSDIDPSKTFFDDKNALYEHCKDSSSGIVISFWDDDRRPTSELIELAEEFG